MPENENTEQSQASRKRRPLLIVGLVVLCTAVVFVFDRAYPRDEAAAKAYLENHGYSDVNAIATRSSCGKNRKLFRFTAVREAAVPVSGQFCFDLFRIFSTVTESPIS